MHEPTEQLGDLVDVLSRIESFLSLGDAYLLLIVFGGGEAVVVFFLHKRGVTPYQYCLDGFFSRVPRLVAASLMFSSMRYLCNVNSNKSASLQSTYIFSKNIVTFLAVFPQLGAYSELFSSLAGSNRYKMIFKTDNL